jgi:hypothetical protein
MYRHGHLGNHQDQAGEVEQDMKEPERTVGGLQKELDGCYRQIAQKREQYESLRGHMQKEIDRLRELLRESGHADFKTTSDVGRDRT